MTKEHLGIALALDIPFFIVMTKIDMVEDHVLEKTLNDIKKLLKASSVNKKALVMKLKNEKIVRVSPESINKDDGE